MLVVRVDVVEVVEVVGAVAVVETVGMLGPVTEGVIDGTDVSSPPVSEGSVGSVGSSVGL